MATQHSGETSGLAAFLSRNLLHIHCCVTILIQLSWLVGAPVHSYEIHYCQCQCAGCVLYSAQESCVIRHSKQICGGATSKPSALSSVKTQAIGELAQSFNRETTRALCHYAYFFLSAAPCICRFIISVSHLLQDFLEQCGVALDRK